LSPRISLVLAALLPLSTALPVLAAPPALADQVATASTALGDARRPVAEGLAMLVDPKVSSDTIERTRSLLDTLDAKLAEHKALEAKDKGYADYAKRMRARLTEGRAALEARWLEVGVALQKPALEAAVKQATQLVTAAKQKAATEDAVAKAEAAVKLLPALLARGKALETKDAKYAALATATAPQIEALQKGAVEARQGLGVRGQAGAVTKARTTADQALAKLKTALDEPTFEAATAAVAGVDAALVAGKALEEKDAEYAKAATAQRTWLDVAKKDIEAARGRQKVEGHKAKVEAARKAAADAAAPLAKGPDAAAADATEKAAAELEKVLAEGKALEAGDKKYADLVVVVTKELEARRAAVAAARQQGVVATEKGTLEAALTELDGRMAAARATASADAVKAAEAALADVDKKLAGAAALAAKDKGYAAFVATATKKAADARAALGGTKNDAAIAAHRAEAATLRGKATAALEACVGKLEYDAYKDAAQAIDALDKHLAQGEALGAANAKYAAEVKAGRAEVLALEMRSRRTWIEAADGAVKAKMTTLAGTPAAADFTEAEKAVAVLAKTVESSKNARWQDKTYLAFVAASEKQAAAYKVQIDQRRVSVRVDGLKGGVDTVAVAAAEAMKGLDGEPLPAAFEKAEDALEALEKVVAEPDAELTAKHAAYVADLKKKVTEYRAKIDRRKVEVLVADHKKKLTLALTTMAEKLKALDSGADEAGFRAADEAVTALDTTVGNGKAAGEAAPAYGKELAAAQARVAPARADIERRKVAAAVAAHKAEVDAAAAALTEKLGALAKPDKDNLGAADEAAEALESALEEGAPLAAKDTKHAALLAALTKKLTEQRAAITKARVGLEVAASKAELDTLEAKLTEALAGLDGKRDDTLYQSTDKQAVGLGSAIKSAREALGEKDAAYAKELTAREAKVTTYRLTLRKKRVDAAIANATEKVKGLAGQSKEALYDEAERAVDDIDGAVKAAQGFKSEDKAFLAALAVAEKAAVAQRAALEQARVESQAVVQRTKVEENLKATEERVTALAEGATPQKVKSAETAITALEAAVNGSAELAKKSPTLAKALAIFPKRLVELRALIAQRQVETEVVNHKKQLEEAVAAVSARLGALGKLEYELYSQAELAVAGLEKVLSAGEPLREKAPAYGKELAAAASKVEGYRVTIRTTWIAAAKAAADEKLGALAGKPDERAFKGAEDAVGVYERTVDSGKTLTKAPAYQAQLAAAVKTVATMRAQIDKRRVELVVEAHKTELDAAEKAVTDGIAALSGKPSDDAYKAATRAVGELESTIESGAAAGEKDPAYAKRLAALKGKLAGFRTTITTREVDAAVAAHKEKLTAAQAALTEALGAMAKSTEPAAVDAADKAIGALETTLGEGKDARGKSPAYAKVLEAEEKKLADHRAKVAKRRVDLAALAFDGELAEAVSALAEAVKGLGAGSDSKAFEAADEAATAVEEQAGEGEEFTKSHPATAAKIAAAKRELPAKRAAIAAARLAVDVAKHKAAVEKAAEDAAARVAALGEGLSPAAVKAAESAVGALESSVTAGAELGKKSPAHAKLLATYPKRATELRAAIAKKVVEKEIAEHQGDVTEAVAAVTERLGALGKLEYELYSKAELAVAALEKVLSAGEALRERDPSYGKALAAETAKVEGYRITIRTTWIAAAKAAADEKLGALAGKPDERAFKGAEEAVGVLERTIESGKTLTKAAGYQAQLAAATKQAAAMRTQIGARRVALVVDAHRVELDEAEKAVTDGLAALAGKPEEGAFKATDKAVDELESTIESGAAAGEKDPAYAKRLAALKAKLPGFRATIAKREVDLAVSGHKEKLVEAQKALNTQLAEMAKATEAGPIDAAEKSIEALETVLGEGKAARAKSEAYGKTLDAEQGKIAGYRARVAKRRVDLEALEFDGELKEASSALAEAVKALGPTADAKAFEAADEAASALEEQAGEGERFAKTHPGTAAKVAAAKREVPAKRAAIAAARLSVELAKHKAAVEKAAEEAKGRVEALSEGVSPAAIKAAESSLAALESSVSAGAELMKKSPAHAKAMAAYPKQAAALRQAMAKKAVEKEIVAHREEVSEATAAVNERLGALGKLEYELYSNAELAVAKLEKVLAAGESLAERDGGYGKELKAAGSKIDGYRITIRTRWIDAAREVVDEKIGTLAKATDEKAFGPVEEAVGVLERTIDSGKGLSPTPAYGKRLAGEQAKLAGYKKQLERRRVSLVVDAHKAELDAAEKLVVEGLEGLKNDPDEASVKATSRAVDDLESTIESGSDAASKDPAYGKRLAALDKKIGGFRATIEARRFDADVKGNRKAVREAAAEASEKLKSLGDTAAIGAAEEAIGALENALDGGKNYASSNKGYERELAVEQKKIAGYRARVAKARVGLEVAEQAGEVGEAETELATAFEALRSKPDKAAFEAAEEAVSGAEEVVEASAKLAKADPKLGRRVAALKGSLGKRRAAITGAKVGLEVAEHKKSVEGAAQEAESRVEALSEGITASSVKAAEQAVEGLARALETDLKKKSPPHAKWLAAYSKKVPVLVKSIKQRAVETELNAHRREVKEAQGTVVERIEACRASWSTSCTPRPIRACSSWRRC
jgi:hypothetical protein